MSRHISEQFESELDRSRSLLMEMAGLVEKQLHEACQAFFHHDLSLADEVKVKDQQINQLEVEIDDLCVLVIARRQPAARDLRTLISTMKASSDLERIGDEAKRIAKMARLTAHMPRPADQYRDLRDMAQLVFAMLARALNAYARLNPQEAVGVIMDDDEVDAAYERVVRDCIGTMAAHSETVEQSLNVIWVARALERIGDHSKNLGGYVVYVVDGYDVRNRSDDNPTGSAADS